MVTATKLTSTTLLLTLLIITVVKINQNDKFLVGKCVSNVRGDIFRVEVIKKTHYVARLLATNDTVLRKSLKWSNFKHFPDKKTFEQYFYKIKKCPDIFIIGEKYDDNTSAKFHSTISTSISIGPTSGYGSN